MKAYSKINFGVKIYKKRENEKLHDIDSLIFLCKKYFDEIKIKESNRLSIKYFSKEDKKQIFFKDCILEKTIKYLEEKYFIKILYDIKIIKSIPQQSGLGGASSDAAILINYFVKKNKAIVLDLIEITEKIGSDVPFFISKLKQARVKNFGAFVIPINKNIRIKWDIMLTDIKCSTKEIFALLDVDPQYQSAVDISQIIDELINNKKIQINQINDLTKYILLSNQKLSNIFTLQQNAFFTGSGGTIIMLKGRKYE